MGAESIKKLDTKNMIMDGDNLSLSLNIDKYDFFLRGTVLAVTKKDRVKNITDGFNYIPKISKDMLIRIYPQKNI